MRTCVCTISIICLGWRHSRQQRRRHPGAGPGPAREQGQKEWMLQLGLKTQLTTPHTFFLFYFLLKTYLYSYWFNIKTRDFRIRF